MRITLDLDEDILLIAKQLSRERGHTVGRVLSDLARHSLPPLPEPEIPTVPRLSGARPVTMAAVKFLSELD